MRPKLIVLGPPCFAHRPRIVRRVKQPAHHGFPVFDAQQARIMMSEGRADSWNGTGNIPENGQNWESHGARRVQ